MTKLKDEWMDILHTNPKNAEEIEAKIKALANKSDINKTIDFNGSVFLAATIPTVNPVYNETPLTLASRLGRHDIAKFLIREGADVDKPNKIGITPLFMAIARENLGVMKTLLDAGADTEKKDELSNTPLYTILCGNHSGKDSAFNYFSKFTIFAAKQLVEKGADINSINSHQDSILQRLHESIVYKAQFLKSIEYKIQSCKEHRFYNDYQIEIFKKLSISIPREIEVIEETVAALLSSQKHGLIVRNTDEKALIMEVLQKSPLLIPAIEPVFQTVNSQGQTVEFADPDISALININKMNEYLVYNNADEKPTASSLATLSAISTAASASATEEEFSSEAGAPARMSVLGEEAKLVDSDSEQP